VAKPVDGFQAGRPTHAQGYIRRVLERSSTAATVHEILLELWPGRFAPTQLGEHVALGETGLALDSIEIVEVLLECDERLGGTTRPDDFAPEGPVSLGQLIDHVARS
jgi:hypothetical protein